MIRRHLLNGATVSDLYEAYQLTPNLYCRWQKEFFEGGVIAPVCAIGLGGQAIIIVYVLNHPLKRYALNAQITKFSSKKKFIRTG